MRRQRRIALILVLGVALATQLFACDTNLFSIIAGDTKETAFIEASTKLVIATKDLNENAKKPEASKKLEELMNSWLSFSSRYVAFPPEWGKRDENWKAKISDLSHILGEIRKYLGKDYLSVHREIMRFSRRISKLYEKMPRTYEASLLLNLTYDIDTLWLLVEKEDNKSVNLLATKLLEDCSELKKAFSKNYEDKVLDMEYRIEHIIEYSARREFATFQLNVLVTKLEDDLTELNKRISEDKVSENKDETMK